MAPTLKAGFGLLTPSFSWVLAEGVGAEYQDLAWGCFFMGSLDGLEGGFVFVSAF